MGSVTLGRGRNKLPWLELWALGGFSSFQRVSFVRLLDNRRQHNACKWVHTTSGRCSPRGRRTLSTKLGCWISLCQQDNASFEYLFLVTICFYPEQPLTSYYVSVFYNKNSSFRKDNNTPSTTLSPRSVLHGNERMKMPGTPMSKLKPQGQAGPRWLKEASNVAFRKLPLWNLPPKEVARRIKRGWINKWPGILSPWSHPHSKYTDFCNPGSQLGTCILTQRGWLLCWKIGSMIEGRQNPREVTHSSFSAVP